VQEILEQEAGGSGEMTDSMQHERRGLSRWSWGTRMRLLKKEGEGRADYWKEEDVCVEERRDG
jgi:hypothetical protein